MEQSRTRWIGLMALIAILLAGVMSAGCVSELSPLPNEIQNHGNLIFVDPQHVSSATIMTLLWSPDEYEPEMFEMIDEHLDSANSVLEVGAGIGVHMAYIGKKLQDKAGHIALEPNPYLIPLLEETKSANGLIGDIRNVAIGYPAGGDTVQMQVSKNLMKNTITDTASAETVSVPASSVCEEIENSLFLDKGNVTLVVEADDVFINVLKNEGDSLPNYVKTIIVESRDLSDQKYFEMVAAAHLLGYELVDASNVGLNGLIVDVFKRNDASLQDSQSAGTN